MTDGRFPEQWFNDRRMHAIDDATRTLLIVGATWSASNRTDGAISHVDLLTFPRFVDITRAADLVRAEWWAETPDGYVIRGYAHHQTTAAQLDAAEHGRMLDRERKARKRAEKSAEPVSAAPGPVRPDIPPDVRVYDTGQDRTGQEEKEPTTQVPVRESDDDAIADEYAQWIAEAADNDVGDPTPVPAAPFEPDVEIDAWGYPVAPLNGYGAA